MLSPLSGSAETLTKCSWARGCSRQNRGVKGEGFWNPKYLAGRRAEVMPLTPAGCRPTPLCGWFVSLSHRFLRWKEKALTQRVVSCPVTQRRTEHSAVGREAPSLTAKMAFSAERGGACTGQCWEQELGTPWAAPLLCRDPHSSQTPGRESTQQGPGRDFVTPGQCPGEGPGKDHPGTAVLSPHGCLG